MLNPIISKTDKMARVPPRPPNPKPTLSRIWKYGIAEETNKERNALIEKIEWINRGNKKNNNPATYLEVLFKNIFK
jgi:hypothetical protein